MDTTNCVICSGDAIASTKSSDRGGCHLIEEKYIHSSVQCYACKC